MPVNYQDYRLHHVIVRLQCSHPSAYRSIEDVLLYKGASPVDDDSSRPDITLEVAVAPRMPSAPPHAAKLGSPEPGIAIYVNASVYYIVTEGAFFEVTSTTGTAIAVIHEGATTLSGKTGLHLFYSVICSLLVLLAPHDLFALHCAGLKHEESGVLIVGPSGRGKTTLAFSLVRCGWSYLSDDTVLLHPDDRHIVAFSFRRDFCIAPEAAAQFPELDRHSWPPSLTNPAKWQVDLDALYDTPSADRCIPRILIVPEIVSDETSSLHPMPRRMALLYIASQSGIFLNSETEEAARHLDVLKQLANQVTAYRLKAGRDLLDESRRAADLLGQTIIAAQT